MSDVRVNLETLAYYLNPLEEGLVARAAVAVRQAAMQGVTICVRPEFVVMVNGSVRTPQERAAFEAAEAILREKGGRRVEELSMERQDGTATVVYEFK